MLREVDIIVGGRIRDRRVELRVTQDALADAIGVPAAQLNDYETGLIRIHPDALAWIAMALDRPLSWLFGIQANPATGIGVTQENRGNTCDS